MAGDLEAEINSAIDFRMPSLGSDMDSGTVIAWRVQPGDHVHKGDVLLDVDTEKSEIEVEVWHDATVAEILVPAGNEVPVGTPLARLFLDGAAPPPKTEPAAVEPAFEPSRDETPIATPMAAREGAEPAPLVTPRTVYWPATRPPIEREDRAPTTRAERRQNKVADLMTRSNQEIPHFHVTRAINVTTALDWLEARNDACSPADRVLPAALLLRATAAALVRHPGLNGTWRDGGFVPSDEVDLGVAVHVRGGGLMTPTIASAQKIDLATTMKGLSGIVERARRGGLRAADARAATITVTNLGDSGGDAVFGLIQPPQVALVGFGRIAETPIALDGAIVVGRTVTATLSADHRANNGQGGSSFLATLDQLLQTPEDLD